MKACNKQGKQSICCFLCESCMANNSAVFLKNNVIYCTFPSGIAELKVMLSEILKSHSFINI